MEPILMPREHYYIRYPSRAVIEPREMHSPSPFWTVMANRLARAQAARRDAMLREAVRDWLPRPLRWLLDHPRLLGWYLGLPHPKGRPTLIVQAGQPDRVEVQ